MASQASKRPTTRQTLAVRLREVCGELGVDLSKPIPTNTALALLRQLGYDASRRRFEYRIESGDVKPPAKVGGRYAWRESSIVDFALSLERSRDWLPGATHDAKRLPAERLKDITQAEMQLAILEAERQALEEQLAALGADLQLSEYLAQGEVADDQPTDIGDQLVLGNYLNRTAGEKRGQP